MSRLKDMKAALATRVGADRRLFSVPLEAAAAVDAATSMDASKKWHTIAFSGDFSHWMGDFRVEGEDLDKMVAAFESRKIDPVVDFSHATVFGLSDQSAAGWVRAMRRLDDKLQARINWTPKGQKALSDREFGYFSPVLTFKDIETETGVAHNAGPVHSVALTNTPFLQDLPEAALSALSNIGGKPPRTQQEEPAMNEQQLKALAKILGLNDGATADDVIAACTENASQRVALGQVAQQVGLQHDAGASAIQGAVVAMGQRVAAAEALEVRANAAETKLAEIEAEKRFTAALDAGKITPELNDWARALASKDPEQFDAWAKLAPKAVPVTPKQPRPNSGDPAISEETRALADKFGMTPEELVKYSSMKSFSLAGTNRRAKGRPMFEVISPEENR